MANSTDINALIARQTTAVTSLEASTSTISQFVNNDANTPVTIGSSSVPSIAGVVQQALQVAGRRNYEINWSQDDLTAYASSGHALFRIYPASPVTFPASLSGSTFKLVQAPSSTFRVQFSLGGNMITVTFAVGQTTGTFTAMQADVIAAAGSLITATIPTALANASGLAITLLGQVNSATS